MACSVAGGLGENRCLPLCDIFSPAITASCGLPLCVPPSALALRVAMRHRYGIKRSVNNGPDHVARDPRQTTGPPTTTANPQHNIRHIDHFDPRLDPPTSQATYHVTDRSRAPGDLSVYERQPPAGPAATHRHIKYETHGGDPLGPSDREFDRIARHITRFDPRPGMPTNTRSYLRVVEFHADRIPHASQDDKIFLIRLTSNGEVNDFIERQPKAIKHDYNKLCKAILAEYSEYGASGTLTAAMAVKQAHNELAECYYHRLRQAFFSNRNYEGMEEDTNLRALYLQNLHPNLSQLLGVYACPLTQDIRQLKTLVARAQGKHLLKTQAKPQTQPTVYSVENHMELEGAPTARKHKWGTDHGPQRNNQKHANPKNGQPRDQQLPQYGERRAGQADGKDRAPQRSHQDRTATTINKSNLSREEQSLLRTLLRKAKEKKTDNADVFAVSVSDDAENAPYHMDDDLSEQELNDDYSNAQTVDICYNQRDVMVIQVDTTIRKMALMRLTVGPMTLVYPVYISPFNTQPLLLGQDLLNRFSP
uniref:Uncharacterized protein n=1 Tax=Knipowitschia caucasica TaxID=637954 RepID=A0AAV2KVN5_KNICA